VNTLRDVTLVPSSVIQQNGQASFVYVIQDNVAHLRSVKPGVTEGGQTQVDGVNPGDVLANSSFDKLQDNTAVTVANNSPNATPTPSSGSSPSTPSPKKGSKKSSSKPAASGANGSSAP
jgi:multidrug efflux system membrane fusion protein